MHNRTSPSLMQQIFYVYSPQRASPGSTLAAPQVHVTLSCRNARVDDVVAFGVFVEILPGKTGLVHVSELDTTRSGKSDNWKTGDTMDVKLLEVRHFVISGQCI